MKYDFETIIDRVGKDAIAVEKIPIPNATVQEGFTPIPMWVADMNFATVPTVMEAITERVKHPTFGYFDVRDEYYDEIMEWQKNRNKVQNITRECIGYENGVLGGIASALKILAAPGDPILVQAPVYIGFIKCLEFNGYKIVYSNLRKDDQGIWRMDYEDMAEKLQKYHIHTAIFCSPHNPTGRVWEQQEIEKAMEVYKENDVYVISDEIWSDLTLEGYQHIPTQSVSKDARERTMAFYAPSKTFNLAGLIGAYHIVYNKRLRDMLKLVEEKVFYNEANLLSMYGLIGAYQPEGYQWVDELRSVLSENTAWAYDFIKEHFQGVTLSKPQGTYMLFLDCTEYLENHHISLDELLQKGVSVGVIWQDGRSFQGENSIRMNLALPKSRVVEAFERLEKYVFV